jgi:hypothetical protein
MIASQVALAALSRSNMNELPSGVRRQRLEAATTDDLEHAADAVSSALGIYAARAAASLGSRASALKLLKGRDILKGTQEGRRGSVIRKRLIDTASEARDHNESDSSVRTIIRPKQRSGRSKCVCASATPIPRLLIPPELYSLPIRLLPRVHPQLATQP